MKFLPLLLFCFNILIFINDFYLFSLLFNYNYFFQIIEKKKKEIGLKKKSYIFFNDLNFNNIYLIKTKIIKKKNKIKYRKKVFL